MMTRMVLVLAVALLPGCDFFGGDISEGTLRWSPEGISGDRDFKVAYFEVFEFNAGEISDTFELRGSDAALTGKLYPMTQLGQGEGWKKLEGRSFTLTRMGGDPKSRVESYAKIPEFGENNVCAEQMAGVDVTKVEVGGGRVVVSGKFRFAMETDKGQKRGIGLFKAVGKLTTVSEAGGGGTDD